MAEAAANALRELLKAQTPLTQAQVSELTALTDALFAQTLIGASDALRRAGVQPQPRPQSMLPGCTDTWLPPELMFELSHLRAFGLTTPPADETLGDAPAMPDRDAPAIGRTPFERSLHPRVAAALATRLHWGFDVFELAAACAAAGPGNPGPLVALGAVVFADHGLCEAFGIPQDVLLAFLTAVQAGYLGMPYHNALHATDVLHSSNYILVAGGAAACATPLEAMAMLLAAAVHDLAHPGVNNAYLAASKAPLARRYNDTHALENFHLHTAFSIMARPDCDLCAGMTFDDARTLRRQLIGLVIATDMADHGSVMAEVARRTAPGAPPLQLHQSGPDRDLALRLALKCADISNAAKPLASAVRWGVAILTEMFSQGDLERATGLPISPLCDRSRGSVAAAQMSFLEHVAVPLYTALGVVLAPAMAEPAVARALRTSAYYASQQALCQGAVAGAPQ